MSRHLICTDLQPCCHNEIPIVYSVALYRARHCWLLNCERWLEWHSQAPSQLGQSVLVHRSAQSCVLQVMHTLTRTSLLLTFPLACPPKKNAPCMLHAEISNLQPTTSWHCTTYSDPGQKCTNLLTDGHHAHDCAYFLTCLGPQRRMPCAKNLSAAHSSCISCCRMLLS